MHAHPRISQQPRRRQHRRIDRPLGLTPLHVAPLADSPWRRLFDDDQLDAHLDQLAAGQRQDGGWAVTWEPPGAAARLEWRGIVTVQAVRTLTSYGKTKP